MTTEPLHPAAALCRIDRYLNKMEDKGRELDYPLNGSRAIIDKLRLAIADR